MSVGDVTGTTKPKPFGFDGYYTPVGGFDLRVTGFSPTKGKLGPGCFTVENRVQGWINVPEPSKYMGPENWDSRNPRNLQGKFGKYKKITFTESIMDHEKNKPSPRHYNTFNLHQTKSPGNHKW